MDGLSHGLSLTVYKDGKNLGEMYPRYDYYPDGQPMTIPAVRSTLADDLYIVLVNWEDNSTLQNPSRFTTIHW